MTAGELKLYLSRRVLKEDVGNCRSVNLISVVFKIDGFAPKKKEQ